MVIRLREVGKTYSGVQALRQIDLAVGRGECLGILGPNGAGKTTLLKVIATLIRPTAGGGTVSGYDLLQQGEEIRQVVGFLSHDHFLYEDLSGLENMRFYAIMYRHPQGKERVGWAIQQVGLERVARMKVGTYSNGMKRRLSLARLMLYDPLILLLDEPYAGLDVSSISMLERLLADFQGKGGTVLMATHSHAQGLSLCRRLVILAAGRLVYDERRTDASLADMQEIYAAVVEKGERWTS